MELQGVLPSQEIRSFIRKGHIGPASDIEETRIQPASLDLTLGKDCWKLDSSSLPLNVLAHIKNHMEKYDISKGLVLEPGCVYLVKLNETLRLPDNVHAYVNPKSTSGRLDIFVRLLTERNPKFDAVPRGYEGDLYLEIVPQSFPVVIYSGISLTQIRFFRGNTEFTENALRAYHSVDPLLFDKDSNPVKSEDLIIDSLGVGKIGLTLTLDLKHGKDGLIGFKAKKYSLKPIKLASSIKADDAERLDPRDFFEPIYAEKSGEIVLDPAHLYILSTNECLKVPPLLCATMTTHEAALGELRSHYAGFFDPGWGTVGIDKGWQATLEVRAIGHPFKVRHGQPICKFVFDILSGYPDKIYGKEKLTTSNYKHQMGPTLAKYFKPFVAK